MRTYQNESDYLGDSNKLMLHNKKYSSQLAYRLVKLYVKCVIHCVP